MGIRQFKSCILEELRVVAQNSRIHQRDIVEWSTGEIKAQDGETLYFLPEMRVHVAVRPPPKKA